MRRLRLLLLCIVALWWAVLPGNSCGPFFDQAVFTKQHIPERTATDYMAGKLGVIQPTYNRRYLITAYLWLYGRGMSKAEQKQTLPAEDPQPAPNTDAESPQAPPPASQPWSTQPSTRKIPGSQWESYDNCLSDAFVQANRTFADRQKRYGATDPEVLDWQKAQRAVFANCGDATEIPAPAPTNASLWLRQDRAYQIASAQFYSASFPAARASFEAIGIDRQSSWHLLARYLAVRAMMRQATLVADTKPPDSQLLIEAEKRLRTLLADPEMRPLKASLESYLGFVSLRADPLARAQELAARISAPKPNPNFQQDLIDLLYAFDHASPQSPALAPGSMADWVITLQNDGSEHALARWRATHDEAWLTAAITLANPSSGAQNAASRTSNDELIAAARAVQPTSPAYATVTYHRLRLGGGSSASTAETRAELDRLLPAIEKTESRSTINLFLAMRAASSPTLGDFLRDAARVPADDNVEGETLSDSPFPPNAKVVACTQQIDDPAERLAAARRFDLDGATVIDQHLSVEQMASAGTSTALPQPLSFETSLAAWSRAVLLDRPEVAAKLSSSLATCQPGMKPWLDKYDQSITADERHINGLFALMRFPSIRPYVNQGFARGDFAAYDIYRDNWWTPDAISTGYAVETDPAAARKPQVIPTFIDKAELEQAAKDVSALKKLGPAPDYFAAEALAWVAAHPTDSRNADLLGFAKRVMRNGIRGKQSSEWDHKLFTVMQKKYPNSSWAKKYATWE